MEKKKRKKAKLPLLIINFVIFSLLLVASVLFVYTMYNTGIVPIKYVLIVAGVLELITIVDFAFIIRKVRIPSIILDVLLVIIIAVEAFSIPKMNEFINFIQYNFNTEYEISVYNIMVSNSSKYNTLEDLNGKTIILLDETNDDKLKNQINEKIKDAKITSTEDIIEDLDKLKKDKNMIIIADSSYYDTQIANDPEYETKVKVIDTIEIKEEKKNEKESEKNVTKNSFIVYISGIDTRSNSMPTRSLSDVNILMAVNPNTKKILLIHTPRDYYVKLHGTTGLPDKLTHAGTKKGGVKVAKATIEDLYDIDIDFYMRVNFKSVIKLVDAIGGIDIYNDQKYTVYSYVDDSCSFKPGWNKNVKGKCALAFARERHAYSTGDKHRGENQEQVLTRVIERISSSKVLLNKYTDILKSLNNSFETDMSSDKMTSLVRMQLDDMAKWQIETYNVTGKGAMDYTYSYPHQRLSVMKPNYDTVNTAKSKIKEVLG